VRDGVVRFLGRQYPDAPGAAAQLGLCVAFGDVDITPERRRCIEQSPSDLIDELVDLQGTSSLLSTIVFDTLSGQYILRMNEIERLPADHLLRCGGAVCLQCRRIAEHDPTRLVNHDSHRRPFDHCPVTFLAALSTAMALGPA
jgi:hypothetical protein